MTILDKIIARKREEVAEAKQQTTLSQLEGMPLFGRECFDLRASVLDPSKTGIIAEFKRASPSKGVINGLAPVGKTVAGYQAAGASAVSVLTDPDFFQGSLADLEEARAALSIPLLRKEFIVDRFQIAEAKAYGADIILLIAACLSAGDILDLSGYAKSLGLSVLLEVHDGEELAKSLVDTVDAIGVNNRNLKDFTVNIEQSKALVERIPDRYIKVAESGISNPLTVSELRGAGFQGFLIGENFMKTDNPAAAMQDFVNALG